MLVELHLRDGKRRIAAYQRAGGCVGSQAVEVRVAQDRDPFLGFLQKTGGHGLDVFEANRFLFEDAAAQIAIRNPLHVFLDRMAAIRNPILPVLGRAAQFDRGGSKFGVSAKQLLRGVPDRFAVVLVEERKHFADRSIRISLGFRTGRKRHAELDCNDRRHDDRQHMDPHPEISPREAKRRQPPC